MNMKSALDRGNGLRVPMDEINEEIVMKTLAELLNNPKYLENAQDIARKFNDRPLTPEQSVVYWTEYAARHKGAKFLRAAGIDLNYIQFHNWDVYFVTLTFIAATFLSLWYLMNLIFCKSPAKNGNKQKKN